MPCRTSGRFSDRIPCIRTFVLLICLGASFLPGAAWGQAGSSRSRVTLQGRIVDAESRAPLFGATVEFPDLRKRVIADANGHFTLRGIPTGEHRVDISQLGYQTRLQQWTVTQDDGALVIGMRPESFVLSAIQVEVDRLEDRRERYVRASKAYGWDRIAGFGHKDPIRFLQNEAGVYLAPCGDDDQVVVNCAMVRGAPDRVLVVIDEQIAREGLRELAMYPLSDIYRIEVFDGGGHVQVYTKLFMKNSARMNAPLLPIDVFRRMRTGVKWAGTERQAPGS